ncbi:MAG: type II toxin-antitoxin system RelE/ParE family toxin [Bacteroidetes bacterium]|nr:type II toxin-antitoxin system RelE/ParE family toxin [Bacteroidota bacterium]
MALEIIWTPRAEKGFNKIVGYIEENWTQQEVRNFVRESFSFFELLTEHPEILEKSRKQKNVYRGPMDKHNILTYRIKPRKKQIELLNIRSAKRIPLKK